MEIQQGVIFVLSGMIFALVLGYSVLLMFILFRKKATYLKSSFELELKNKELEKMAAVVQALEEERATIARNLHDEVGSILSLAHRNLETVVSKMPSTSEFYEDVDFTKAVLDQSVEKVRSIAHGLLPHFLVKFGLIKTFQHLMDQTQKSLVGPCTFHTEWDDSIQLNQQHEIHFYSIVLELINNLLKHARPNSISMLLYEREQWLVLNISHDGVAMSQSDYTYFLQHGDGMGLESIHHRLLSISGELQYTRENRGGSVKLAMPFSYST